MVPYARRAKLITYWAVRKPSKYDTTELDLKHAREEIEMPSQNGNGSQGSPWGSGAKPGSGFEDLVRQGQDRLKRIMPSGGPRGAIVVAVLALVGLSTSGASNRPPAPRPMGHPALL